MMDRWANQAKRGLFYAILAVNIALLLANLGVGIVVDDPAWLRHLCFANAAFLGLIFIELCGLVRSNG